MTHESPSYHGDRFPADIISHAVWLYHRFGLSFRDTEDSLAQRGVTDTHETIRRWCRTFGPQYARALRRRRGRMGDTWCLDELFVKVQGRQQCLWPAVDEHGDVIDSLVQSRRNHRAAERFFRKLLKRQGCEPRRLITDKLRSSSAALSTVMPSVVHCTDQYANNRRSLPPTNPAARATDATLQIRRPRAAVRLRARPGAESLPSGSTSATGRPPPVVEKAGVSGLERGDLRLLSERRRSVSRQRSTLSSSS